jgi:ABC-type branched-subunit amino acid transport system substrate-binding protein
MILVPNHRLPSNGNKLLLCLLFFLLVGYASASAKDKHYRIALLLPLNFHNLDPETILDQKSFEFSNFAIDYYRGFKSSIDSLSKLDYTFEIKLYDTQSDTNQIKTIAVDPFIATADMIVGPFMPNEIQALLKINKSIKHKIISPISPLLITNTYNSEIIMANNTLENHAYNMANYFVQKKLSNQLLIVRAGLLAETRFSKSFEKYIDSAGFKVSKKEILTTQKGYSIIEGNLSKTKENYILIPSADQAFAINLFKYLEGLNNQYPITLLVHPKWLDYQTIDPNLFVKYKVTLSTSYYANYSNPALYNYVLNYRSEYGTEPTEMSIRAFDQAMFYLTKYSWNNKSLFQTEHPFFGLATVYFYPSKISTINNNIVFIVKYDESGLSYQP